MQGKVEGIVDELIRLADGAGVRLGVLGGASSMLVSEGGPRLFDTAETAPEILPEVQTGLDVLETLKNAPETLDWFYVSPAASFGAWVDAPVTGAYRLSDDVLLTDANGVSRSPAPTSPWPSSTRSSSRDTGAGGSTSLTERSGYAPPRPGHGSGGRRPRPCSSASPGGPAMTRVGLVLGAGGVVGQAYHAGVLAVLEHDFGFDARGADMIVGTSAGSITGTLLRLGVSAERSRRLDGQGSAVRRRTSSAPDGARCRMPELAPLRPLDLLRRPMRLPGPHMVRRALTRPWQFRPLAAAHDAARARAARHRRPAGRAARAGAARVAGAGTLWICAVRRRDGRRVVFGRPGPPPAPIHLAIAASCAVPGYFAPVRIGERSYVDGGVHSPTNAAILRGAGARPGHRRLADERAARIAR